MGNGNGVTNGIRYICSGQCIKGRLGELGPGSYLISLSYNNNGNRIEDGSG